MAGTIAVEKGDKVLIQDGDVEQVAEVETLSPNGGFSVHWYSGCNRYAPHLPGHWFAEFNADSTNRNTGHGWKFVCKVPF